MRMNFPEASFCPVRVNRSFCSWLIMAVSPWSRRSASCFVRLLNEWSNYDMKQTGSKPFLARKPRETKIMPKLKRSERDERGSDYAESLDRGLRLLQMFATSSEPMTLSDLARSAELPRATARRMLFTLERGGYVASHGKLFTLTPHVLTLAASYLRSSQIATVLHPVLDRVPTAAREYRPLSYLR